MGDLIKYLSKKMLEQFSWASETFLATKMLLSYQQCLQIGTQNRAILSSLNMGPGKNVDESHFKKSCLKRNQRFISVLSESRFARYRLNPVSRPIRMSCIFTQNIGIFQISTNFGENRHFLPNVSRGVNLRCRRKLFWLKRDTFVYFWKTAKSRKSVASKIFEGSPKSQESPNFQTSFSPNF